MGIKEFNQTIGKILGLRSGEVMAAQVLQNPETGVIMVTLQIKTTPKQKQKFLDFIIEQAGRFKAT